MYTNDILKKIENNCYNIQYVINCCCLSIKQLRLSNQVVNINSFLTNLSLNLYLYKKKQTLKQYKIYNVNFYWDFTVKQIFTYSILVFYDLRNSNITQRKFITQLEKEMRLYSTYNAEERVNVLISKRKIYL